MRHGSQIRGLALALAISACGQVEERPRSDDALTLLLPREPQEIDPRFTGDAYGLRVSRLLFASLVTLDPHSLEVVPDLAEEVQVESPSRYRVRLRPGLRFADGSALDADDVIATYRSVVDPDFGSRYASTYRRIARIEALDRRSLRFTLHAPHATFLTDLELPILRAEDRRRHLGLPGAAAPVASGPYRLSHREPGRLELSQNPHWHGGKPLFPQLRLIVLRDDNTRVLRMLAGAGDLALNAVPPLLLPLFEQHGGFRIDSAAGLGTTYLGLNLDAPVLSDRRVRAALAHALDRRQLLEAKLGGRGRLARGFLVPGHWAADEGLPSYDFDPARARALLDQAGFARDARGVRLKLTLRVASDRARLSLARAIAAMLADVGVQVAVRPTESATLFSDLGKGRFEMTLLQVPEVVEPHMLSWFFGSDRIPGAGSEGANRWRLRSVALDAALERGRARIERAERVAAYRQAQRILAQELPVIPLWHEDVIAVGNARARAFRTPRLGRFGTLAR